MVKEDIQRDWPGWIVGKRLGGGGFGTVYEISREVFGDTERKALKVIHIPKDDTEVEFLRAEGISDETISTTFFNRLGDISKEYKIMAQLRDNPNIVHCEDLKCSRQEDGIGWIIYIKMELLTPLLQALDRVQTESQILELGIQMCNALTACQSVNIIHRDIKPQNILVSPNGTFKLGDFGISRTLEHTTKATAGIGTFQFMAPEVAKAQSYGPTVDIYSLGMVLYWLLNERRGPFLPHNPDVQSYAQKDEAIVRRFSGEPLPMPKNGSIPLKLAVLKACSYDPKDRYQTPQAFMEALIRIRNGADLDETVTSAPSPVDGFDSQWEPSAQPPNAGETQQAFPGTEAPSGSASYQEDSHPPMGRMKWLAIAGILTAALLLGILISMLWPEGSTDDPPTDFQTVSQDVPSDTTVEPSLPAVLPTESAVVETTIPTQPASASVEKTYVCVDGGLDHTVTLYSDGTVEAVGSNHFGQCDVGDWTDIVQISTLRNHTVGLRSDGTVVAVGDNSDGQCNVENWTDIVAVSAGDHHTVGVRSDGTVVAVGKDQYGECQVQGWDDVIAVGASYTNTFGLCSDGTVFATGSMRKGKIPGWEGIQAISVSDAHIVGLCRDGTVKATGNNNHKQCDLSDWRDIVAVRTGCAYSVGLKADGTVLVSGINDVGQYGAKQWTDIAYIATGLEHTIGVKSDGTFVAVGSNDAGQCDVSVFSQK